MPLPRHLCPTASHGQPERRSASVQPDQPVDGRPSAETDWPPSAVLQKLLSLADGSFGTVLADPPWRFRNRTGKIAPEHRRLYRYPTLSIEEIGALPVARTVRDPSHLYLWCPNALLPEGLAVMERWGFTYKTNLVWLKTRQDGGPDGRGVGFYFRNVTELCLFGVRGTLRTERLGRRQVNLIAGPKREHSRKPDRLYEIIEASSPGPFLELFAREQHADWRAWGNQIGDGGTALLARASSPDLLNRDQT